ncbi:hypothetical protein [Phormidium sp. CCY1219]|uniref:hypothetical protein n=1 Tax=Phormidium sp. CCY1219 TaxID=2886104 RepID=UPI002D1EDD21|nr:hypothetical protein [Phormidium sp. CCY1219]MEB3827917.1 hypothetical protein [Phormidium sp. CCY1219]
MNIYFRTIISAVGAASLTVLAACQNQDGVATPPTEAPPNNDIENPGDTRPSPPYRRESPNLDELPDGTYFYGEVGQPQEGGENYVIFNKNGLTLVGVKYTYQTGNINCFKGEANDAQITDAMLAQANENAYGNPNAPRWIFSDNQTISLRGYEPLETANISPSTNEEFVNCRQIDYQARL